MNISNIFLLIARDISVDENDKMLSIIKVIDQFNSDLKTRSDKVEKPKEIVIPTKFSVASSWMFDEKIKKPKKIEVRVSINDPKDKNLGGPNEVIELPLGTQRFNLNFNIQGLKATHSGVYQLVVKLLSPSKKVYASAKYPFDVNLKWQHEETKE